MDFFLVSFILNNVCFFCYKKYIVADSSW